MASGGKRHFLSVTCSPSWGALSAEGFHLYDNPRLSADELSFTVCHIDSQQIVVFADLVTTDDVAAAIASKPEWFNAIVSATVVSKPSAEVAMIEAHVPSGGSGVALEACAFAAACVTFDAGSFTVVPKSYLIRFGAHASVRVSMSFDDNTASWFGEAAVDPERQA